MTDATVRGRFLWHELMTPNPAAAQAFYSQTLGWRVQAWEQDPSYSMFATASGPVAGIATVPEGAPHWLTYMGAPDIEQTVQQATALGAVVVTEITQIPNAGRYAVLKDPQGARFGLYSPPGEAGASGAHGIGSGKGEFSWHELATTDYRAAFEFYSALFGWERIDEHDMGPMGIYFLFGLNGTMLGGLFNQPLEMPGEPNWLGYVRVPDPHQAAKKVQKAGGRVINGPMEVPGGDWIVQFLDPEGAAFAVHTLQADLKSTQREPKARPAQPAASEEPVQAAAAAATPGRKKSVKKKVAKAPARRAAAKAGAGQAKSARGKAAKKKAATKKIVTKKAVTKKAATKKPASKKTAKKKVAKKPARKVARRSAAAGKTARRPTRRKAATQTRAKGRRSAAKSAKKKAARKGRRR